jgi:hypothetical protein
MLAQIGLALGFGLEELLKLEFSRIQRFYNMSVEINTRGK